MNEVQYYLSKIAEESSEIAQIAMKCAIFGYDDRYPNENSPSNFESMIGELNDLIAMFISLSDLDEKKYPLANLGNLEALIAKQEKARKWMLHSIEKGCVTKIGA